MTDQEEFNDEKLEVKEEAEIEDSSEEMDDEDNSGEISEEELDRIADISIAVLQDILKHFDIGEVTIDEYEGDEGELILDITGSDLAVLIGRHGNTLNALQLLFSTIVTRKIGYRFPVVVDIEGYKSRMRQKLEAIARTAASRAVKQGRSINLHPMTPYERRIVHMTLSNDDRVVTNSEGEGGQRHIVVSPTGNSEA